MRIPPRLPLLPVISAILAASLPASAPAQEGRVNFTYTQPEMKLNAEMIEDFKALGGEISGAEIPTHRSTERLLLFNSTHSVIVPVWKADQEMSSLLGSMGRNSDFTRSDFADMSDEDLERILTGVSAIMSVMESLAERSEEEIRELASDPATLVQTYVDFEDGSVTETREFMERTFLVKEKRPAYEWRIADEQRELLGYVVHKATTVHDGAPVEAWFAPQIPVQAGPETFGGLPGLILMVSIDDGDTVYLATGVDLTGLDEGDIRPPEDGNRVSRDEWERVVADKLKELASTYLPGGGRRPFR